MKRESRLTRLHDPENDLATNERGEPVAVTRGEADLQQQIFRMSDKLENMQKQIDILLKHHDPEKVPGEAPPLDVDQEGLPI